MTELNDHYSQHLNYNQLIQQVADSFPEGPTCFDLAPLDQLHIGGIKASKQLLKHIKPYSHPRVLDVGAGLGGLLRLAASEQEIDGVALDFTYAFSQLNQALNLLSGSECISVVSGDAQLLPFASDYFDCVIFQHSLLNIPKPSEALKEALRVLKPGGRIVCHEVIKGQNPEAIEFPVPWAARAELSFLHCAQDIRRQIESAGFEISSCDDWTEQALMWRARQTGKEQSGQARSGLSPAAVLGNQFAIMGKNVHQALQNGAIGIIELAAQKPQSR